MDQPISNSGDGSSAGGSGSLAFNIVSDAIGDAVCTMDQNATSDYQFDQTIAGSSSTGQWNDSGKQSSVLHDTETLNADGTGTDSYTATGNSSDTYKLNVSGTTSGSDAFTYSDTGTDQSSTNANGDDSSGSDNEDYSETESISMNASGNGASYTATDALGREVKDISAYTPGSTTDQTTTTENDQNKTDSKNSGTIDGATYSTEEKQTSTGQYSDVATTGSSSGNTDDSTEDRTRSDDSELTISGLNESSSPGSGSNSGGGSNPGSSAGSSDGITESGTSSGTSHEHYVTTADPNGGLDTQEETDTTSEFSNSDSGTDLAGPFSQTASGTGNTAITGVQKPPGFTITGDIDNESPPNGQTTGTPPSMLGGSLLAGLTTSVAMMGFEGGGVGEGEAEGALGTIEADGPAVPPPVSSPQEVPNPLNEVSWGWDLYYGIAYLPNSADRALLTKFANNFGTSISPDTKFAQFLFKHSLQGSPNNLIFPVSDSFTRAILASPEYADAINKANAAAGAGNNSGTLFLTYESGDLHYAIGHGTFNWNVTTDSSGNKIMNVKVSDLYDFESNWSLIFKSVKGAFINQYARAEQLAGALNPYNWETEPLKSKLK